MEKILTDFSSAKHECTRYVACTRKKSKHSFYSMCFVIIQLVAQEIVLTLRRVLLGILIYDFRIKYVMFLCTYTQIIRNIITRVVYT